VYRSLAGSNGTNNYRKILVKLNPVVLRHLAGKKFKSKHINLLFIYANYLILQIRHSTKKARVYFFLFRGFVHCLFRFGSCYAKITTPMEPPKLPEMRGDEPFLFRRFRLMRKLGAGGMGIVYEAFDERRGTLVALKTLKKLSPTGLAVLKREFRLAAELSHPNLVRFYDLVATNKGCGFSMEMVEGQDLLLYIRGEHPDENDATQIDLPTIDPLRLLSKHMAPVKWVKENSASYDSVRLLLVLPQLCAALDMLHQAGLVHRDLKPQNILVTRKGAAKLIDLGIAQSDDPSEPSEIESVSGTPHYMSPEQARGERVGPPSDLYSLGVLLYVLLAGRPPFNGKDYDKILQAHADETPPPPSSFVTGIPKPLETLCLDLLRKNPARRPSAREVARRLQMMGAPAANFARLRLRSFVGRGAEVHALSKLGAQAKLGSPRGAFLQGESGSGKSLLCAELARALSELGWRVIAGRCYEREFVAYNGVDPLIDAIAVTLLTRTSAGQMPPDLDALATIFSSIAQLPGVKKPLEDEPPAQRRQRAAIALRELLQLYRQDSPLVIWMDDLQWVDHESIDFLVTLLQDREGDPLPLLFLGTCSSAQIDQKHPIWPLLQLPTSSTIQLTPFAETDVAALLGEGASSDIIKKINVEARGNAFLAAELASAYIERASSGGDLQALLLERLQALDVVPRRILEGLAVSESATSFELLQRVLNIDAPSMMIALDDLRCKRWVREVDHAQSTESAFDIYLNRIREVVYQATNTDERQTLHRQFAKILAGINDPGVVAKHLIRAGDVVKAAPYLLASARRAATQLAVDRANELYLRALSLGDTLPGAQAAREERASLLDRTGGRYAEAAQAFREASSFVSGAEVARLLLLAAESDLKRGEIEAALEAGTRAMAPYEKLKLPTRGFWAVLEAGYRSFRVNRKLKHLQQLPGRPFSEKNSLLHLLYHRLGGGLTFFDLYRSAVCNTRALSHALAYGSDDEVVSALAFYSFFTALRRGRANFEKAYSFLSRCEAWLPSVKDQELYSWVEGLGGMVSCLGGDYEVAQEVIPKALERYRALGRLTGYEISAMTGYWMVSFLGLGQPKMAIDYMAPRFARAVAEGNLLEASTFAPILLWCYPMLGQFEAAQKITEYKPIQGNTSVVGIAIPIRHAALLLAEQKVSKATELLEDTISHRFRNGLFLLPEYYLRARACLASAYIAAGRKTPNKSHRTAALWQARRIIKPLITSQDPVLEGVGFRLMGLAELTRGKDKNALIWLNKAVASLQENGEAFELAAALLARGALRGNSDDISQGKLILDAGQGIDPAIREGRGWSWR
jgi:eukaryotic-like serine/threonine-protein kinase